MQVNNELITRAKKLQYPALAKNVINKVEQALEIKFSPKFYELAAICNYEYFVTEYDVFYNIGNEGYSPLIERTLALRKNENCPKNTLFLSQDDSSLLLMKCLIDHEEVYRIEIEDYYNYCEGKKLNYKHQFFPTFTDFFAYLLDEEEKHRTETQPK